MYRQISFLTLLIYTSCGHNNIEDKNISDTVAAKITASKKDVLVDNALTFINAYVDNCNKMKQAVSVINWVNSSNLTTQSFKTALIKLINEANRKDPELGLDADPIFDAQDYPEKGFELEAFDGTNNYLTLKGKEWSAFKLTIKMKKVNDKWLVEGCGMINIPNDKRARR